MRLHGDYLLKTDNTTDPFTLSEVNEHLKESFASFAAEPYLVVLIQAVKEYGEEFTRRVFLNKAFTVYFPHWNGTYEIRRSKLVSIGSVKYIDEDEATQTVDPSLYATTFSEDYAHLYFDQDFTFPSLTSNNPQKVIVELTAGYGAATTDIPDKIKLAMLHHLAQLWKNRGDCPKTVDSTLDFIANNLPPASRLIYSMERIVDILL